MRWEVTITINYLECRKVFDDIADATVLASMIADAKDENGKPIKVCISPFYEEGDF